MNLVRINSDKWIGYNPTKTLYKSGPLDSVGEFLITHGVESSEIDQAVIAGYLKGHNYYGFGIKGSFMFSDVASQSTIETILTILKGEK